MARKLSLRGGEPRLDEMSSDGQGVEFGQPLSNQAVPTGYMVMDNPVAEPQIDRKRPPHPRSKQFGLSTHPQNWNDLSVGEAGAGISQFRRAQFFSSIGGGPVGNVINFDDFVYDIAIGIATARAADMRPRFWHVSFFAVSAIGGVGAVPFTESDILNTAGKRPTNTTLKGRVQVFDESGSRFYDVDIHGTASFSFYGWGVTTSILLPSFNGVPLGFEVNAQNPPPPIVGTAAENTLATGRIIPTFQNVTQITDQATATVSVPAAGPGVGAVSMPIPPGSTAVRIRKATIGAVVSGSYFIGFASSPSSTRPFAIGVINRLPGRDDTQLIAIPNATFIVFLPAAGDPAVDWVATFVTEV